MGRYTPERGEGTGAGWVLSKSVHLKTRNNSAIKVLDKRCGPSTRLEGRSPAGSLEEVLLVRRSNLFLRRREGTLGSEPRGIVEIRG